LKHPKVWLSKEQTEKILAIAKVHRIRDWLILELRDGEILGRARLPGILVSDIRDNGIWLTGKGYSQDPPELYELPAWLVGELKTFSAKEGRGPRAKLFDLSVRQLEYLIKDYAREAGIEDWKLVKPHRLRAFFASDLDDRGLPAFTIRNMMRHKNIGTTNTYVGRGSPAKRAEIMESLSR
jgi:integrase